MTSTVRRYLGVSAFVAYLSIQLVVPAIRMGKKQPFGWQMFSTRAPIPQLAVVLDDGRETPVEPAHYMAFVRGDLPLAALLPPHLCRVVPRARAVSVDGRVMPCP